MLGARRGQLGMCDLAGNIQAQVLSAGVLSFIAASWGAHTQFTFQKYAFFRPSSTPSDYVQ